MAVQMMQNTKLSNTFFWTAYYFGEKMHLLNRHGIERVEKRELHMVFFLFHWQVESFYRSETLR